MQREQVHLSPQAKVNFTLSVGSPLASGMHPIESKMARIALSDELEVTKLDSHALSRYAILWHPDAPLQSDIDWPVTADLAVRAHRSLEQLLGHSLPVQMKLEKRIPVGGGLGGGSADAAAMLKATIELFNLDIDPADLALQLGSDVPFFLFGKNATVCGLGDEIEPLELETTHLVLVCPEYSCKTADVYKAFDSLEQPEGKQSNDLLLPAYAVERRLEKDMGCVKELINQEIYLSGSGSTFFVICNNTESASEIAKKIEQETELVAIATRTC
ncbi:MAG: hypothetical protein HOC27_02210 [Phycisphaerae bacterium]|jgi:4-diphosphocytidyl-2-C-methyl-D-erythritol kinase|nr:hypothetical protein [Phycisphaerae bacterium]